MLNPKKLISVIATLGISMIIASCETPKHISKSEMLSEENSFKSVSESFLDENKEGDQYTGASNQESEIAASSEYENMTAEYVEEAQKDEENSTTDIITSEELQNDDVKKDSSETKKPEQEKETRSIKNKKIYWNDTWEYASFSQIHTDSVTLYRTKSNEPKNITVAINAGHGCSGGSDYKTQCHPDGSAKVTGGSTSAGAAMATAINEGTTLNDGTSEASAVLDLAVILKEQLLNAGYDVLMIRENNNTQLDNIARTVFANNNADCHISLHYDSTSSDKGFFCVTVPDVASYRQMEPVASHWQKHNAFANAILSGVQANGIRLSGSGIMALDLTQTSYSTIPSVDVEVGDRSSDHSVETQNKLAKAIVDGINNYAF